MGKDGEFKYKEQQRRLVESEPEVVIGDEVAAGSDETAGNDEAAGRDEARSSKSQADNDSHKTDEQASKWAQKPSRPDNNLGSKKPPKQRPATGIMVLALSCVFVGLLVPASAAIHVGRASLRAQIGALFGGASDESISSSIDLVEVLYRKCLLDYRRNQTPRTEALDSALDSAVKKFEKFGIQDRRLGVLKLRQSSSAVFRGDKKRAAQLANEAMQFIPARQIFTYDHSLQSSIRDPLLDTGMHLNHAGQYAAAVSVLEARLAHRSRSAHECLEGIREELGNSYYHSGDYKNAYRCYQEAFDEAKGPCLGKDPSSMRRMGEMGSAKVKMHEYQEAVSCFKRTFGFFSDRFGEKGHRYTARFVPLYAEALMATGDYTAAEQLLQKSMTEMKQNYPRKDHWAFAQQQLAAFYQHANKPKEAAKILDALIKEVREGNPGPSIDELTRARKALGVD